MGKNWETYFLISVPTDSVLLLGPQMCVPSFTKIGGKCDRTGDDRDSYI